MLFREAMPAIVWTVGSNRYVLFRVDLKAEQWEKMRTENKWNNVELRDNRYNQVAVCQCSTPQNCSPIIKSPVFFFGFLRSSSGFI